MNKYYCRHDLLDCTLLNIRGEEPKDGESSFYRGTKERKLVLILFTRILQGCSLWFVKRLLQTERAGYEETQHWWCEMEPFLHTWAPPLLNRQWDTDLILLWGDFREEGTFTAGLHGVGRLILIKGGKVCDDRLDLCIAWRWELAGCPWVSTDDGIDLERVTKRFC